MDNKTRVSSIGEARIISEFIEQGYDVFTQFNGKSPIDLVVYKDGKLLRVEVKSTQQRNKGDTGWMVELKKVRANRTRNRIISFDKTSCDILAVYIEPIKRVLLIESDKVKVISALTLLDKNLEG